MVVLTWHPIDEIFDEDAPDGIWDRRRLDRSIYYEQQALTDGRRWGRRPKSYEEATDGARHP